MSKHSTLTHNYDAERLTIQAVLLHGQDNEILSEICSLLPDYRRFTDNKSRDIWRVVGELYSEGSPVSIATISNRLLELDKKNLYDHIYDLYDAIDFLPMNEAVYAAKLVNDSYIKRCVTQAIEGKEFQDLMSANGNLPEALEAFQARIDAASQFVNQESSGLLPWRPKPLSESRQPKPPREYIVDGILIAPSLSIWYGPPGSLKTMILIDLAMSVCNGLPWLGHRPGGETRQSIQTKESSVLWLDQDSGEDEIERRFQAVAKAKNVDDRNFHSLSFPMPAFQADDPGSVNLLIKTAQSLNAKLIIIDCLNAISGEADENSPQMANVMAGLRLVTERTGGAVAVVHHPSKDNGKNIRGHSSINSAIDLAMVVNRDGVDAVDISLESTKTRKTAPVKPFGACFAYEPSPDNPRELDGALFFGTGAPVPRIEALPILEQAKARIRQIAPSEMNQSAIVEATKKYGIGRNNTISALAEMVQNEELTTTAGERNAVIYSIADV